MLYTVVKIKTTIPSTNIDIQTFDLFFRSLSAIFFSPTRVVPVAISLGENGDHFTEVAFGMRLWPVVHNFQVSSTGPFSIYNGLYRFLGSAAGRFELAKIIENFLHIEFG